MSNPYDAASLYDDVDSYDGAVLGSGGGGVDRKGFEPWYKKPKARPKTETPYVGTYEAMITILLTE